MTIFLVIRLLVGLLSLSESFRPEAEASARKLAPAPTPPLTPPLCTQIALPKGARITAEDKGTKKYCGSDIGSFLVLEANQLLHLSCLPGNLRATVTVSNVKKNDQIFSQEELCTVEQRYITKPKEAKILANALRNTEVPYDDIYCNSEHYFGYLARAVVRAVIDNTVTESCPVFEPIPSNLAKELQSSRFQLHGKNFEYPWPTAQGPQRKVLSVATMDREVPITFPDALDENRGGKQGNEATMGFWVPRDLRQEYGGFRSETPSKGGSASKRGSSPRGGSPPNGGSPLKGGSPPRRRSPPKGGFTTRSGSQVSEGGVSDGNMSDGYVSDGGLSDGYLSDGRVSNGSTNSDGTPKNRRKGWGRRAMGNLVRFSRSFSSSKKGGNED